VRRRQLSRGCAAYLAALPGGIGSEPELEPEILGLLVPRHARSVGWSTPWDRLENGACKGILGVSSVAPGAGAQVLIAGQRGAAAVRSGENLSHEALSTLTT